MPIYYIPLTSIQTSIVPPAPPIPFSERFPLLAKIGGQTSKMVSGVASNTAYTYRLIRDFPYIKHVLIAAVVLGAAAYAIYLILERGKPHIVGNCTVLQERVGLIGEDRHFRFAQYLYLTDGTPYRASADDSYVKIQGNFLGNVEYTEPFSEGDYYYLPRSLFNEIPPGSNVLNFMVGDQRVQITLEGYNGQLPGTQRLRHAFEDDIPERLKPSVELTLAVINEPVGLIGRDHHFNFSRRILLEDGTPFRPAPKDAYVRLKGSVEKGGHYVNSILVHREFYLPRSLFNQVQQVRPGRFELNFQLDSRRVKIVLRGYSGSLPEVKANRHLFEDDIPVANQFLVGREIYESFGKHIQLHPIPEEGMADFTQQDLVANQTKWGMYQKIDFKKKSENEYSLQVDPNYVDINHIYMTRQPFENRLWIFIPHRNFNQSTNHGRYLAIEKLPMECNPSLQFYGDTLRLYLNPPAEPLINNKGGGSILSLKTYRQPVRLDRSIPIPYPVEVPLSRAQGVVKIEINELSLDNLYLYESEQATRYTLWVTKYVPPSRDGNAIRPGEYLLTRLDLPSKPVQKPFLHIVDRSLLLSYTLNPTDEVDLVEEAKLPDTFFKWENSILNIEGVHTQLNPPQELDLPPFNFEEFKRNQAQLGTYQTIPHKLYDDYIALALNTNFVDINQIYFNVQRFGDRERIWIFIPHQIDLTDPKKKRLSAYHGKIWVYERNYTNSRPSFELRDGKLYVYLSSFKSSEGIFTGLFGSKDAIRLNRTIPPEENVKRSIGFNKDGAVIQNIYYSFKSISLYYSETPFKTIFWVIGRSSVSENLIGKIELPANLDKSVIPSIKQNDSNLQIYYRLNKVDRVD